MREKKLSGLTIFLAVIVVTTALVALALGVVAWVIGIENMATFERFTSAFSSIMFSLLMIVVVLFVIILLVGLGGWLSNKDEGIKIRPFEVANGEDKYNGEAISHLFTAELLKIWRIHNVEYVDDHRSIESKNTTRILTSEKLVHPRLVPATAPTTENLTSSLADVVVSVPGVASVSLGALLAVLKVLWPLGDTGQVITGSLQKYGSMISLVVCLEHHEVRAWDVRRRIRTYDQVADEHIPGLVRDLSFKIAHGLSSEASSKTWQGLKYHTEALDAYHEYTLTNTLTTNTEALDRACKNCIKAANVEPGYEILLGLLYNIGIAYTDKRLYIVAEKLFRQAIAIKSDYPNAFFGLGYMCGVQNHHDEALEYFDMAIKLDPKNADFWCNRCAALMELGKHEDALNSCQKAIELDPTNAVFRYVKGTALMELGNYKGTLEYYEKMIVPDPTNVMFWYGKAVALMVRGNYEDALEYYEIMIDRDPTNVMLWYGKAVALMARGNYKGARESYEMAIKLEPENADFWNNKGVALMMSDNHDAARESYVMAIKLDPTIAVLWHNKGLALRALGRHEDALKSYEKAIELDPEDPTIRTSLAALYRNLGRKTECAEQCELARQYIKNKNEYNRAWFEAVCGSADEALNLLRAALEKKQANPDWTRRDLDLDILHDDPRFWALLDEFDEDDAGSS